MNKKPSKPRSHNYEKKLAVDATFDELLGIALGKDIKKDSATVKERTSKGSRKSA